MEKRPQAPEGWETEDEFSEKTGRSKRALREDRRRGRGAPWSRWGKYIYYRTSAAGSVLEANEQQPVNEKRNRRSRSSEHRPSP